MEVEMCDVLSLGFVSIWISEPSTARILILSADASILLMNPSNTAFSASGLIFVRCCTNADADGISPEAWKMSINSFVILLLPIPMMFFSISSNGSLRFLEKSCLGSLQYFS